MSPRRAAVSTALSIAALLAFLLPPPALATTTAAPHASTAGVAPAAPGPDLTKLCAKLQRTPAKAPLCTHGPDPLAGLGETSEPPPAPATALAALCFDGGVAGRRIEILYGVPQDKPNRYSEMLTTMRNVLAQVDDNLDASDGATTQHYRFLCENGVDVTVRNVSLVPVGIDGSFTWDDYVTSLQRQVELGLGPKNFVADDRVYMTFVDQVTSHYPYGGQGSIYNDDRPDPGLNANNQYAKYSMTAYFSAHVVGHELGHNIGAAQLGAPHSSGAYHCHDDADLMCYSDGGSYFQGGGQMTTPCASAQEDLMDCGKDDYYYPGTPPASNYLATHWNTASSGFLTPVVPDRTPPTVTSRVPAAGAPAVAATATVTATFSEAVQGVSGSSFVLRAGTSHVPATVTYDPATRTATLRPSAALASGTSYTAALTGGATAVRDAAGNGLTTTSWSFTTGTVTPVVSETFGSSAANFTTAGGTWTVSDGRYVLTAPASTTAPNANLSVHTTTLTGDFTVDASGSTTATTSAWNDFSVAFGYRDTANYYFASFSESNDAAVSGIFKVAGGTRTQLADITSLITAGTMYPVRIERQGSAIRVYRSGTLVASTTDSTFTTGRVGFGTKNDGATFDDLTVTGTVLADTTSPTVSTRSPAAGATGVNVAANVTATFDEAVQGVSGTTFALTDSAGIAVPAAVTYNAASRVATLDPSTNLAADTRYTATVTGGPSAIRDTAGNALLTKAWTFTTGPAPTVTSRTPASAATGVSRTGNVTATFSEPVQAVSTSTMTLRNSAGTVITATVTYDVTTRIATLDPSSTLAASTTYTVTLTGSASAIRDSIGNPLATTRWSFTTGA